MKRSGFLLIITTNFHAQVIKGVTSLVEDKIVVFYHLCASEILPDQRGDLLFGFDMKKTVRIFF
jgi:hypothetical protein